MRTYVLLLLLLAASPVAAHPIPRKNYERTITVTLSDSAIVVDYRLEVDDWTIVYVELPAVSDQVNLRELKKPADWYEAFSRAYAPILANNLTATLDGKPLTFRWTTRAEPKVLDHILCDFRFQADCSLSVGQPHTFTFREDNYHSQPGKIALSLAVAPGLSFLDKNEPDAALKARPLSELKPNDEERLRQASARVAVEQPGQEVAAPPAAPAGEQATRLVDLLFSEKAFPLLLLAAFVLGAGHALTPGHGKTLVAAYLIGERGTVWHAILLGVVVTLSHTGMVLLIAAALPLFFPREVTADVQVALGFGGGLLVTLVGFWVLLRRLSGQADHVHIGGGHHHHHHGHEHDHVHPLPEAKPGAWGLIVLGINGGIVPCTDAVVLLGYAITAQLIHRALPLLLSFSAGLAAVLVVIGIAVVRFRGAADSQFGQNRRWQSVVRVLPIVSAVLVTLLGLWLCYDSLHHRGS